MENDKVRETKDKNELEFWNEQFLVDKKDYPVLKSSLNMLLTLSEHELKDNMNHFF